MKTTRITILFLLLTTILCAFCYRYIDRPVVNFLVQHDSQQIFMLRILAHQIPTLIGLFVFLFYIYFAIKLDRATLNQTDLKLLVMCNATVIATFFKSSLKVVFGRYWAATYVCNNPSFINDNAYGFHWFTTGRAFESFPSGHATFIFSFSISMWFLFPKWRKLWVLLAALVIIGQISMYYHFVSDILAGAALGSVVAIYNYRYWIKKHAKLHL